MQIKEVEKLTSLTAKAIRLYEERGLISVTRGQNTYRDYSPETVEKLRRIRLLRGAGISLSDISLWSDGVITLREILAKRKHEIRNANDNVRKQYALCEKLLSACDGEVGIFDESDDRVVIPDKTGRIAVGIDIGTTTISASAVDTAGHAQVETWNFLNGGRIPSGDESIREQDPEYIYDKIVKLIDSIMHKYGSVSVIGIAGQMHGIVYTDAEGRALSPLITWQDRRSEKPTASGKSYADELSGMCNERISGGFGFATHYMMTKTGTLPAGAVYMMSVMDYLLMRLCALTEPVTHASVAASFGLFDVVGGNYSYDRISAAGLDNIRLPKVVNERICGNYRGVPVAVAIGDNQAGVFGALAREEGGILLNYGTGSQINAVTDRPEKIEGLELRPYLFGKFLQNGSALCGGRAYALLESFFGSYTEACGIGRSSQYEIMNKLAVLTVDDCDCPKVDTRFCGSRECPEARGSISGISEENFTPGKLIVGVLRGMADELADMAKKLPETNGLLVASGNAVRKNPTFRRIIADRFGKKLFIPVSDEETAFGTALFAAVCAAITDITDAKQCISYQNEEE